MQLSPAAVRLLCVDRGWLDKQLANEAGLAAAHVSNLLSGRQPGTPPTWKKLADALGVPVRSILLDDDGNPLPEPEEKAS